MDKATCSLQSFRSVTTACLREAKAERDYNRCYDYLVHHAFIQAVANKHLSPTVIYL